MLALSAFTALHEMRLGRARSAEWRTLTDTIVLVQALCELGKLDARVCQPDLGVALDGLRAALEHPGGTMGLQGDALEAASRLVCVFDDALGRLAAQTIDLAAAHVVHRIRRSAARPGQPESPGR
jgi:hypothetical protein